MLVYDGLILRLFRGLYMSQFCLIVVVTMDLILGLDSVTRAGNIMPVITERHNLATQGPKLPKYPTIERLTIAASNNDSTK